MYSDDKEEFRKLLCFYASAWKDTFAYIGQVWSKIFKKIVILVRYRLYAPDNNAMIMSYIIMCILWTIEMLFTFLLALLKSLMYVV